MKCALCGFRNPRLFDSPPPRRQTRSSPTSNVCLPWNTQNRDYLYWVSFGKVPDHDFHAVRPHVTEYKVSEDDLREQLGTINNYLEGRSDKDGRPMFPPASLLIPISELMHCTVFVWRHMKREETMDTQDTNSRTGIFDLLISDETRYGLIIEKTNHTTHSHTYLHHTLHFTLLFIVSDSKQIKEVMASLRLP